MAGTLTVQNLQGPSSGANANKVIIPSGQTLDASNGFTPPAGHVVQVLKATPYATTVATTTYTIVASISVTVSEGSDVLVLVTGDANFYGDAEWHRLRFHRDGTAIGNQIVIVGSGGSHNHGFAIQTIDEGLSAGTYEYTLKAQQGFGTANYGEEGAIHGPQLVLMEIKQ